jgi:hypothetical protein
MGILCDYFIAAGDEEAARTASWVGGPADPAGALPTIDLKGLDPVVPMASLESMISGGDLDELVAANAGAMISDPQSETVWVFRLSDALTGALAGASSARLGEVAEPWSRTEELAGSDAGSLAMALDGLAGLARQARSDGGRLYCWVSL